MVLKLIVAFFLASFISGLQVIGAELEVKQIDIGGTERSIGKNTQASPELEEPYENIEPEKIDISKVEKHLEAKGGSGSPYDLRLRTVELRLACIEFRHMSDFGPLYSELEEYREERERAQKEILDLSTKREQVQTKYNNLLSDYINIYGEVEGKKKHKAGVDSELKRLDERKGILEVRIAKCDEEIKKVREQIHKRRSEVKIKVDEIEKLWSIHQQLSKTTLAK